MALTPQSESAVAGLELERVRNLGAFPVFMERDDVFFTMIEKRSDIEIISNRACRIPIQIQVGGTAAQGSADGSGLGRGSGSDYEKMQVSTLFFKLAIECTLLAQWATDSAAKARANATKRETENGTKAFRTFLDRIAHTAGDGILCTVASGGATTSVTVDDARLITPKMQISMYASGQATQRSGGTGGAVKYVLAVDVDNNILTLDNSYSDGITGDVICVGGLSGASPVSMYGIPYFLQNTGTVLTLSRTTYPQLKTPLVPANSVLTQAHPRQLLTKIRGRLGVNVPTQGGFFLAHPNNVAAWEEISILTQETTPGGKVPDPLYDIESGVKAAGRRFFEDLHQSKSRIEFILPQTWGRAVTKDIDLVKVGDQTVFPTYSTTDGAPNSSYVWYLGVMLQFFCDNPAVNGAITALQNPVGYA